MKVKLIVMVVLAFVLKSCATQKSMEKDDTAKTDTTIVETFWELEELNGEAFEEEGKGARKIGFELTEEENRVSGFAGCNQLMGGYTLKGDDKISFSQMASTRMACPDADFDEGEFLKVFEEVASYETEGSTLKLLDDEGTVLGVFSKESDDASTDDITEKRWKLKTLDGETVEMDEEQKEEVYFTLKQEEQRATGFGGCNNFTGSYKLKGGGEIEFSQMASTMKACPNVDFNESEFVKIFQKADNYTVNEDTLTLKEGENELAEFEAVYLD